MFTFTGTICMILSVLGLVGAGFMAVRRRPRAALRWFGAALLPTGLYLTGLITVVRKIGTAIGDWAVHLVFDPKVWAGVILLAVGVAVLAMTGLIRRGGRRERAEDAVRAGRGQPEAAPAGRSAPAVGPGANRPAKGRAAVDDEFKEIEDILKRRGI